mmetsp:Transcript_71232/g.170105  ORF Transcript_71232/g.170105 Transcript_71232/m.170105 type:complete len:209 (-) Transcript_71232:6-632(-)
MFAAAPTALNCRFRNLIPAPKMAMPSTKRMFESTEPRRFPWTTWMSPALTAWIHMIISTALPKVAFSRPPIICPVCEAIASVEAPRIPASGTMAKKLKVKIHALLSSSLPALSPKGTKMRSTMSLLQKMCASAWHSIARYPRASTASEFSVVGNSRDRVCSLLCISTRPDCDLCIRKMPLPCFVIGLEAMIRSELGENTPPDGLRRAP